MSHHPRRALACWALGAAAVATLAACSGPAVDSGLGADGDAAEGGDYLASFATFEPVEESGDADAIIDLPDGVTQALVTATYTGERAFLVSTLTEDNAPGEQLVSAVGAYEGVTALGLGDAVSTRLEVTADGPWTITLSPIAEAPELPASGTGDGVYRYTGDAATWTITHAGEHYFALSYYTGAEFEMPLLVTEMGAYDGEAAVEDGPALVAVHADGEWTITPQ